MILSILFILVNVNNSKNDVCSVISGSESDNFIVIYRRDLRLIEIQITRVARYKIISS